MPVDMKLMISSTFVKMAQTKNIDKITVKDLVEQCGISRQTFYYHFKDIMEVMEWLLKQIVQKALQNSIEAENAEKSIEEFIRVSVENQELLVRMMLSQYRLELEHIYTDAVKSSIYKIICKKKPELSLNHKDMEILLNFYAYGISGAVFENCRNNEIDIKYLSDKLYKLVSGCLI